MRVLLLFGIFYHILGSNVANAIITLNSDVFGDVSKFYQQEKTDSISYLFSIFGDQRSTSDVDADKAGVAMYRGFIEQGANLKNFCTVDSDVVYESEWSRKQVLRTVYSTLQYVGIDVLLRALPVYATHFGFSKDEYKGLGDNLIGNYCSRNLTMVSIKQLKSSWNAYFEKEWHLKLPSVRDNSSYNTLLQSLTDTKDRRKQEFYLSIELFKSLCSWGNDVDDMRLLIPLIKNPVIMSFVISQLAGLGLEWDDRKNVVNLKESDDTIKIVCIDHICRRSTQDQFEYNFIKSVGSIGVKNDLMNLYCKEMQNARLKSDIVRPPKVETILKDRSLDEQSLMVSQFISLLTGRPDLLIGSKNFSDAIKTVRSSVDNSWNEWAADKMAKFSRRIYFEESISIDVVNRRHYYTNVSDHLKVVLDVNLGEFDKNTQKVGKLMTNTSITLAKSFLAWAKEGLLASEIHDGGNLKRMVLHSLKKNIDKQLEMITMNKYLEDYRDTISIRIRDELVEQLESKVDAFEDRNTVGLLKIPIEINYGLFALRRIYRNARNNSIVESIQ